jgi:AraC family transcriptional regulator
VEKSDRTFSPLLAIATLAVMSNNEPPQHLHFLSSYEAGWDGLHLIYELEPAYDPMPETFLGQHFIVIALDDCQASFMLNGQWKHINYTKGDIGIFPATQLFPKTYVDREVRFIELFLEPSILARAVSELVDIDRIELLPKLQLRDPLIEQVGLALLAELEAGGAESQFYVESMATALSAHLLRRHSVTKQDIHIGKQGLPQYKLREVVSYIHENLDQNLTLAQLAGVVYMSPHYFSTVFKEATGLTPCQYVTKCRIDKAKQLLIKPELTIVEICQQVGFQNQSHFTRVFRKYTNTTPKVYRDKC